MYCEEGQLTLQAVSEFLSLLLSLFHRNDDIDVDEDMEKYREHMELIVRTLALTKDEYSEQIKLQKMLNKKSNLENQEDLDEDELKELGLKV